MASTPETHRQRREIKKAGREAAASTVEAWRANHDAAAGIPPRSLKPGSIPQLLKELADDGVEETANEKVAGLAAEQAWLRRDVSRMAAAEVDSKKAEVAHWSKYEAITDGEAIRAGRKSGTIALDDSPLATAQLALDEAVRFSKATIVCDQVIGAELNTAIKLKPFANFLDRVYDRHVAIAIDPNTATLSEAEVIQTRRQRVALFDVSP
jgi:hypothetical protein